MAEVTNRHDFYHSDQNESTNYPSFDEVRRAGHGVELGGGLEAEIERLLG
eukprot:CAMPEP_0179236942 /NCGR_PEP_ID=MMETSP0797-20121207/14188_1 /TAXON_ID=47934 /ORGANISM="Dinophysis acuminata, Strain DAEP01" /LENGTH=49 /DNA_ID= /DNA_START= /DNA_END= /DNA_ORIENTATION=